MRLSNKDFDHEYKIILSNFSILYNDLDLESLMSDATPLATQFIKRSYKISHNPGLLASLKALPSFAACSKIRPDF